jgi:RHS repeat-associated protein
MNFHTDLNGASEELIVASGDIVWECSFQLWGKRIQEIEHISIQHNLRYQGQYLDRETGLHYNTFRYYDPDIGRFTQPDPIGLLGWFNLYQYAPSGLIRVDPFGLSCSFNSKSNRWRNNETGRFTKRPTDPSELARYGKVNKADIDAWATQRGIPNTWHADPKRFPSGEFRYEGQGYQVHGNGIDPTTKAKWPTANSANGPTASIKNTINGQNYRTDGIWGTFKSDPNSAHIPLNGSFY